MPVQFSVLASGSRGNSALVRGAGSGLLIDLGIGPRVLAGRMADVGAGTAGIGAALLTHTHSDHIQESMLGWLVREGVPLYCHEGHQGQLARLEGFLPLWQAGLVRHFDDRPFLVPSGMRVEAVELKHDGGPTFGFRVEAREEGRGRAVSIGYLADTGCWWDAMADSFADVNLLGVEFNHDVPMQMASGRSRHLVRRVIGDRGHLSNDQGAGFVSAVLERSRRGTLRDLVLLHLSRECNTPGLAVRTARSAVRGTGHRIAIHAAHQDVPSPNLLLQPTRSRRSSGRAEIAAFPWERDGCECLDQVPLP